jgi:hypothetical protein
MDPLLNLGTYSRESNLYVEHLPLKRYDLPEQRLS